MLSADDDGDMPIYEASKDLSIQVLGPAPELRSRLVGHQDGVTTK